MILDLPLILETRRSHALEHATIHLLSHAHPEKRMAGHSNPSGFFLFGNLSTTEIWQAATEAHARLNAGESDLAIHPGCGTNMATTALLSATFAWLPLRRNRTTLRSLALAPFAVMLALVGFRLSRPLGPWLQRHVTTEADLGDMQIIDIVPVRESVHRVILK
ncbi:MAG: DUF6391 domain-containing protein [Anaerolineales bacterium]|nr:DUF6391 domain-containing protein [Anaerolineales bacterium]